MGEFPASRPSLWRNRDYVLLWSGQTASNVGTNASGIAFPLLVLALTHSALQAGLIGALARLPFLVLSLPAGALVDRWDRKRLMIRCDVARALAFAAIPLAAWTGRLGMPLIYMVVLIEGIGFAFFNLAEVSALPRVVPREQLPAATAQNQVTYALGGLIGPPVAGVLFGISRVLPFLADACSYAASVVSLLFVSTEFQGDRPADTVSLRAQIVEGLRWLWAQPLFRFMAFLTGGFNLAITGAPLIVIVLLQRDMHAGPSTIGWVFGVMAVGGIGGALMGTRVQRRFTYGQAMTGVVWLVAALWSLLGIAPNVVTVTLLGVGVFLVMPTYDIVQFSYRVALIPDELQGRVNSIFRLIAMAGVPAGQLLAGALLEVLAPRQTVFVVLVVLLVLAAAVTTNPHVRGAPPVQEAVIYPAD